MWLLHVSFPHCALNSRTKIHILCYNPNSFTLNSSLTLCRPTLNFSLTLCCLTFLSTFESYSPYSSLKPYPSYESFLTSRSSTQPSTKCVYCILGFHLSNTQLKPFRILNPKCCFPSFHSLLSQLRFCLFFGYAFTNKEDKKSQVQKSSFGYAFTVYCFYVLLFLIYVVLFGCLNAFTEHHAIKQKDEELSMVFYFL